MDVKLKERTSMYISVKVAQDRVQLSIQLANVLALPIPGAWEMPDTPVWSTDAPDKLKLAAGPNPIMGLAITDCQVDPVQPGTLPSGTVTVHANVDIKDGKGAQPMTAQTLVQFADPSLPAGIIASPKGGNVIVTR